MMKPKVKPLDGYRYRLILVDDKGHVEFDDFDMDHVAGPLAERLMPKLARRRDASN